MNKAIYAILQKEVAEYRGLRLSSDGAQIVGDTRAIRCPIATCNGVPVSLDAMFTEYRSGMPGSVVHAEYRCVCGTTFKVEVPQ